MNFRGSFYYAVIYKDDSHFWSNEELKIKAKELMSPFRQRAS